MEEWLEDVMREMDIESPLREMEMGTAEDYRDGLCIPINDDENDLMIHDSEKVLYTCTWKEEMKLNDVLHS